MPIRRRRVVAGPACTLLAAFALPSPATAASCPGHLKHAAAPYRCAGGAQDGALCSGLGDPACGVGECLPAQGGRATWYAFDGGGACSFFDPDPAQARIAAINEPEFAGSAACGRCLRVTGQEGSTVVRVADLCPEEGNEAWCGEPGHLDLSRAAFDDVADPSQGAVPVAWETVPCPVGGGIDFHFEPGSNPWWVGINLRDHRHGVATLEVREAGSAVWTTLPRTAWNVFVATYGGQGIALPATLRITDVFGQSVTDTVASIGSGTTTPGSAQFPERPEPIHCDGVESGAWEP